MKKYKFRLETVRRVRHTEEETARTALVVANNEVQQAISAVEARVADYALSLQTAPRSVGVESFMQNRYFNDLAAKAVLSARDAQHSAEAVAAVRREDWKNRAMSVKVLDRLDERRREEHRLEADREADKEVDDIVTGRFKRTELRLV